MQVRRQMIVGALGVMATTLVPPLRQVGAQAAPSRDDRRRLRVLSTTDRPIVDPLIEAFEQQYPGLAVDYQEAGSAQAYQHFVASNGQVADVVWSSAMDLQIKLANDGLALAYRSPHAEQLPSWASWRHEAYATTWEPVGFVFDRQRLAGAGMPRSHAALLQWLLDDPARCDGCVASYDIERSGIGFLLAAQDMTVSSDALTLVSALGRCGARLHANTLSMLQALADGEALVAFNALGSYAEAFAQQHPQIAVVYPEDYTLITSRVALISRRAREPDAAQRWLDFLLSPHGQHLLGQAGGLHSIRLDAPAASSTAALQQSLGAAARPIPIGPGLLTHLDRSKHELITRRWLAAYAAGRHLRDGPASAPPLPSPPLPAAVGDATTGPLNLR